MKETNQENNFNILNTTMLLNCRLQDHSEFKSGIQNGRTDEEKLTKSRTIVQNFLNKLQRCSTYHESSASIPQGNKFHSNGDLNSDKNLLNNTKKSFEDNSYTPLRSEISSIENKKPERSGAGVGSGLCYNRRTRAYNRNYTINISDNLKANIGFSDNCTKIPVKEKNVNESVGFDFKILKEELCNNNENDFENEKSHKRSLRTEALGNKTKFVILNNMLNKQTDENVDAKNVEEKCGHVVVITEKTDKNASYDTNSSRVEDNLAFRASRIKRQNFRSYVRSHSNIEGLADGKISKNKLFDNNQDGVIDDNTDGFAEKSNKNGSREEDDADQFKSVILPKYYENLRNGSIDKNFSSNSVDINNNNLINASHDKVTSERVMSLPNTNAFDKNKIDYNCIVKPSKSFVHLQDTTRKANKSEELVHNGSQHKVTEQTEKLNNMNLYAESKVQTNYNGENYSLTSSSVSSSSSSSPPSLPTSSPPPLSPSPSLSDLQKSHFPSFISALPPTTPCNLHTPIMLQCILNNKDLSITWFKNSSKIHETNNLKLSFDNKVARLIIFDVTKDDLGCYKCEAGSNSGFVSTQTDLKPINNNQKDGEEKDKLLRSTDIQVRRKIREELAHLRKNVDNASGEKEKSLNLDESHISSKESRTNETNNVNSNKTTSQSNTSKSGDIKSEVPTEGGLNKVNEKASTKNSSSLHRVSANLINTVKKDDDLEHESAQVKEKLMNGSDGKLNESKPSRRELIRKRLEQARERMKQIDIEFKTEDCIPARNHRTELSSTLSLPASVAQASNPPKSFFSNHKSLSRQDDATKGSNTKITIDNNRSLNDKQAINQANITNSNINSSRINSFKQFDRNNNDCQENQWKVHYKNASYNQPSNSPPDQTLTPELLAKKLSDLMNGNEGIYGNVRVKTTEWNSHNNKKNHVAKTVSWTPACKDGDSVQKKEPSFRTPMPLQRSASNVKQKLLQWCNIILRNYPNMHVSNFSTSWNDGMAFCAIIHYFLPEKIDFDKLDHNNHKHNFQLAFETAESCAGVLSLLEVQDMVDTSCPDWKSVFMYVESLYRAFVINKAAEKFRKKNLLKES